MDAPDTSDMDTATLLALYEHIGGMLCDKLGHDWQTVEFKSDPTTYNTADIERCQRCSKQRMQSWDNNTNNTETIQVTPDE